MNDSMAGKITRGIAHNTPAISYSGVTKSFADDHGNAQVKAQFKALDGVTLNVAAGEFLAIVGNSGSGKTTLLRLANRLIDTDAGSVKIFGHDVRNLDPITLRRRIGYVVQSGGLFPHMSVAGNIGITPRLLGQPAGQITARVGELLDLVQLDHKYFRDRFPHELSGGQRQRVGVARALAAKPDIMLLDEPFGALDPLTRDALSEDYKQLHRKFKLTTVMITHDMAEAVLLSDRIAVIRGGKLIAEGNPAQLTHSRDPYVLQLLNTPRRQAERLQTLLPQPDMWD